MNCSDRLIIDINPYIQDIVKTNQLDEIFNHITRMKTIIVRNKFINCNYYFKRDDLEDLRSFLLCCDYDIYLYNGDKL